MWLSFFIFWPCFTACGISVPWPGIKPSSLALEGRFLTTGPPGKSQSQLSGLQSDKGVSHVDIFWKSIPGRGNCKCKGPGVGAWLACSWNSREFSAAEGFPSGSGDKESACNVGDLGSIPWVGKIPWRQEWLPTPVFLPGESHEQGSLAGYSSWGCTELDMTEAT